MIDAILISTNEQLLKPVTIAKTGKVEFADEVRALIHTTDYTGFQLWQESAMIYTAHNKVLHQDKTRNANPLLIFHGDAILTGVDKNLKYIASIDYYANIEHLLFYITFSIRKQSILARDKLMLTCAVKKKTDKPFIIPAC